MHKHLNPRPHANGALCAVAALTAVVWSVPAHASYHFDGCYTDDANRMLPALLIPHGATIESCADEALSHGYRYFGLQAGGQCFAGYEVGFPPYVNHQYLLTGSPCQTPCDANPSQICGDDWYNSVYDLSPFSGDDYVGCYTDHNGRAMPYRLIDLNATRESCIEAGALRGFPYVGLQNFGECYAGDTPGTDRYAYKVNGNQCNTMCDAENHEICGGVWRNSVFETGTDLGVTLQQVAPLPLGRTLWNDEGATFVVKANREADPNLLVAIRNASTGALEAICQAGANGCTLTLRRSNVSARYQGYVRWFDTTRTPLLLKEAMSTEIELDWNDDVSVNLTVSETTLPIAGTTHLVATTNRDVQPSRYYILIYDEAGTEPLHSCPAGTVCEVNYSVGSYGTHQLKAYIAGADLLAPVPVVATSQTRYVTWTSQGYRVTLDSQGLAESNRILRRTLHLQIFNQTTGVLLADCAGGLSCFYDLSNVPCEEEAIAFIADGATTFLPGGILATSQAHAGYECPN